MTDLLLTKEERVVVIEGAVITPEHPPSEALCRAQLAKVARLLSGRLNPDDEAQLQKEAHAQD